MATQTPATRAGFADRALSAAALRERFAAEFTVRPGVYWADMLASAALGWAAFGLALFASRPALALAAALVATLALYRAALFIHELAHLRRDALPGFEVVWHLLVGLPLQAPSLLYVGSHGDHHRTAVYGTEADPEYEPIAHWNPLRIVLSSLLLIAVPAALVLRWAVLGPLSRCLPRLRPLVVQRISTLVINGRYLRRAPRGRQVRRWAVQEAGAALFAWLGIVALLAGWLPPRAAWLWYGVGSGLLMLNHVRTLAAHRYRNAGGLLDVTEQLRDSVNLMGPTWLTPIAAPVGLRYHALHHLAPTLPYHSLGRVHRALQRELSWDSVYLRSASRGVLPAVAGLLREAASGLGHPLEALPAQPLVGAERSESTVSAGRPSATVETAPAIPAGRGAGADAH